ncbi:MAG TPA: nucleoside triphosphate pyrophosphohydrolase [Pantanalinema sp.]
MGSITVVGLGPGDPGQLTLAAKEALDSAKRLFLRTEIHPTTPSMRKWGLKWESFDPYYQQGASFQEVYGRIVARLVEVARTEDVVYAVPGHPLVAEDAVTALLKQDEVKVEVVAGLSALDAIYAKVGLDPNSGMQVVDGLALEGRELHPDWHTLVMQLYSPQVASEVKLHLMRFWPDDHPVTVIRAAGVEGLERLETVPLYEIDRLPWIDYLSSLYLGPGPKRGFSRLVSIISRLRAPDGCPWDREQTPESLRKFVLEEAYETVEAIDSGDEGAIEEELGDLLLQVVLQAQIFAEQDAFDVQDVCEAISDKLVRRHPHVFGEVSVSSSDEVIRNWADIKAEEKAKPGLSESALAGVGTALPALVVSEKLQAKASRVRFDWADPYKVLDKVEEELAELKEAMEEQHGEAALTHELGDVLTAVVNLSRQLKVDPEEALRQANARFKRRFQKMEDLAEGKFAELELDQMEALWQRAKAIVG